MVYFIYDSNHAEITIDQMKSYTQGLKENSKSSKKNLQRSIKYANQIFHGQISFDEVNEIRKKSKDSLELNEEDAKSISNKKDRKIIDDSDENNSISSKTYSKEETEEEIEDEEINEETDEDEEILQQQAKIKQKKQRLMSLIESMVFIKINTPAPSGMKNINSKLSEISELIDFLFKEHYLYQVYFLL